MFGAVVGGWIGVLLSIPGAVLDQKVSTMISEHPEQETYVKSFRRVCPKLITTCATFGVIVSFGV